MILHTLVLFVLVCSVASQNSNAANPNPGEGPADPNPQGNANGKRFEGCSEDAILLLKQEELRSATLEANLTSSKEMLQTKVRELNNCETNLQGTGKLNSELALKLRVSETGIQEMNKTVRLCLESQATLTESFITAVRHAYQTLEVIQQNSLELQNIATEKIKNLTTDNQLLLDIIAHLKKENTKLRNESETGRIEIDGLVGELEEKIIENVIAETKVAELMQKNKVCAENLTSTIQNLHDEMTLKENATSDAVHCNEKRESMGKHINLLYREKENLNDDIKSLKEQNKDISSVLITCNNASNELGSLNADLALEIVDANITIEALRGDIESLTETVEHLKTNHTFEIESFHSDRIRTETELRECIKANEEMNGIMLSTNAALAELDRGIQDLRGEAMRSSVKLQECKRDYTKLHDEFVDQSNAVNSLQNSINTLFESYNQLFTNYTICQSGIATLESSNGNLTDALLKVEEKLANLTEKLKEILKDELNGSRNHTEITEIVETFCNIRCNAILELKIAEMNSTIFTCERKLAESDGRNTGLTQKLNTTMQRLKTCNESLFLSHGTIEDQENTIERLGDELLYHIESSKVDKNKLKNLHGKLHSLKEENLHWREKCSRKRKRMNARIAYVTNFALSSPAFKNHEEIDTWDMLVQQGSSLLNKSIVVIKDHYPGYIDKFLDLEFQKFIIDLKKAICICEHGGKCRFTPLRQLFTREMIRNTIEKISKLIGYSITRVDSEWVIHLSPTQNGRFPLDPIKATFVDDILPEIRKYAIHRNEALLDKMRERHFKCECPDYASGSACEIVTPGRHRRECDNPEEI
uniref:CAP-Gly domain-containing linker protein 1-like n=1 Tax=Styela clava TaxID=7725 RepID=UPI001939E24D|nr:CAP-Gly domain-containing linker protein 1-like [Styela clava]